MKWMFAVSLLALLCGCATTPKGRPMKLVVEGERGTMFTAAYTVDGVRQEETAVMPATISFAGRNAEWEVRRPSGDGAFMVEFWIGEFRRQVTHSSGKPAIRGQVKYSETRESTWAHPVD